VESCSLIDNLNEDFKRLKITKVDEGEEPTEVINFSRKMSNLEFLSLKFENSVSLDEEDIAKIAAGKPPGFELRLEKVFPSINISKLKSLCPSLKLNIKGVIAGKDVKAALGLID
jgi:hypothetical protein